MKRYRSEARGHVDRAVWHTRRAQQILLAPMGPEVAALASIAVLDAYIEVKGAMDALAEVEVGMQPPADSPRSNSAESSA